MRFILKHETEKKYLVITDEDYQGVETSSLKEATRFPTDAAAIVALEDSDFLGEYCPEPIKG